MGYKDEIAGELGRLVPLKHGEIAALIEVPPSGMGDFAFPCFSLAKVMRKNPVEIASDIARKVKLGRVIEKVEVKGAYLNFFIRREGLVKETLTRVVSDKSYGSLKVKGKKALIEHTSINPNASPHVGRARNAIIGDSLARLFRFHGYDTEVHYFVNDVGKQIAMLVLGCKGKNVSFSGLLKVYVDINKRVESNPELEKEIFGLLKKLEDGDKKVVKAFRDVVGVCIKGQSAILSEFGINYDSFDYESKYLWDKKNAEIIKKFEKTGRLFTDEEGRKALDISGFNLAIKSPVLVLTRADGTSLYPLRDVAYTLEKMENGRDRNIVVLGEDHKLYFRELSAALAILGRKAPEVVHYSFILLPSGKMSTRKGEVVLLEDFMREAVDKARVEVKKRNLDISAKNLETTAKMIGYGAVKYAVIRVNADKNVIFDWDKALSFEGDSAPYVQYAHARICSVLKKSSGKVTADVDFEKLGEPEEVELVKLLLQFPDVTSAAFNQLKPHMISNFTLQLAEKFNGYYHKHQILAADKETMKARLLLVTAVSQVLKRGLNLLGIDAPERM